MALHDFTIGFFPSRAAHRLRTFWGLLLGIAVVAVPSLTRAQVAVPFSTNVQFVNTSQVATYVVNLGTLPARPELVIDAIPTGASSNLEIQIEISEVQISSFAGPESCPEFSGSPIRSAPSTGPAQLVWKVWVCDPPISGGSGETARVSVRVASFGSGGAPANVQIAMRGVTSPPAATQLMPYWTPGVQHTVTLAPSRDTTLYERNPAVSDGTGQFLWAGRDVDTASPFTPHAIRSLVVFPIRGGPIPTNATIDSVTLRLDVESIVGSGNQLQVWSAGFNPPWDEGIADAAGNEFQGTTSGPSAANWTFVTTGPDFQWGFGGSTGGDPFAVLSSQSVTTTGIKTFSSTALRSYVAGLLTNTSTLSFQDGFVLRGAESSSTSSGLQLASRENTSAGATKPELVVTFSLPAAPQESKPKTGSVYFIDEGQNLRWIYDLDQDDVYVTPVNGVCTVTQGEFDDDYFAPYTYAFNGTPGYSGHDCCTWHVDSPATGTVGTGQLIFYHNLDTSNPANLPSDTDRDGIRDLCDNCALKANGPLLGSCLTGPKAGAPCRSNVECTSGACSLSQEDTNSDKIGDACVPEPGFGALLGVGLLGLVGFGGRKRARRDDYSSPSRRPAARIAASATSRSGSLASHRR